MADRTLTAPHVVVIGDLLLDVVITPAFGPARVTDVVGDVQFRQGGSAGTTARCLARLGTPTSLITSVGRDMLGDALVSYMERCKVVVHAVRPPRVPTGRMVVLLDEKGERSFVADRRAATALSVSAVRPSWLAGARGVHVPGYCLFGEPLASATRHAVTLAKGHGARLSLDLSSASFISAHGPGHVREQIAGLEPQLIVTTAAEARALLGHARVAELTDLAPIVVVKRGSCGATVLLRSETVQSETVQSVDVPTEPLVVADTTGAGDAFVAGFLRVWLRDITEEGTPLAVLVSAARAGHRSAARELFEPRPEILATFPRPG
ncbi:MAG: carbohydrate kinase family protein [Acidimicrobiales bacterium]|jgi:sugar/nucleoside kinase (ribokinase family)